MIPIWEDLVLPRQECAARVDEINTRQVVLECDLLRTQVLLYRHRVIGAALDRRVVRDDHALVSAHAADAGDDSRARRFVVVHPVRGEGTDLEEWRAGVEQRLDALAGEQLACGEVAVTRAGRSALADLRELRAQLVDERG